MGRCVRALISKSALRHNLQQIRSFAPHSKIMAMVKANAYGHGLVLVAKSIQNVDAFGVARIEEALVLRQAGITTEIVLMEGIFHQEELLLSQIHDLTLVVHHRNQIQALQEYHGPHPKKFKVWLKINTGMNRLGFDPREFEQAYEALHHHPYVHLIGFMTHFSQADEREYPYTLQQYEQFDQLIGSRPGEKSLANSAGVLAWPQTQKDWVRPGLMLYGASPFPDLSGKSFNLKPAMTLCSEIIALRDLSPGEKVGYRHTWENQQSDCKIAIVAVGYGDGYPWQAKNGTPVLVNNQRATIVGRVSMDMLMVDVTHLKEVKMGDLVTLWGEGLPAEEVARSAGTLAYELFCRLTSRVVTQMVN